MTVVISPGTGGLGFKADGVSAPATERETPGGPRRNSGLWR